jgi:GH25 family lysozyme M1 (1,4-beta-N-acetylmuramidase)
LALQQAHGISFGACKATEAETFFDPQFSANWADLVELEIPRIAYSFARPDTDPRDDVEAFLTYVDPWLPTDLLCLDLETSTLGQDETSAWAEQWALHCRQLAPGYVPGVYMGSGYLTNRTGQGLRGPFGWLWYPRYPSAFANTANWPDEFLPPPPKDRLGTTVSWANSAWGGLPDLWQFSSTFISGQGSLDANLFNGTLDELRALNQR